MAMADKYGNTPYLIGLPEATDVVHFSSPSRCFGRIGDLGAILGTQCL